MPRVKETGKYIYRIAKAELKKKIHLPDLILIPDKRYKKAEIMKLKFVRFNEEKKEITFKITKRDHKI